MLKKIITYTNYDGEKKTKEAYFNLNKIEVVKMNVEASGGMKKLLEKIVAEDDIQKMWNYFEKVVDMSYGEKSLDGDRFIKDAELTKAFKETEAYVELMMELLGDAKKAAEFMNAVLPQVDNVPSENANA